MRRALPVIAVLALLAAVIAGQFLRSGLELELSVPALQARIASYGWKGPALYLVLVVFRQFLAIPAMLLLTASGICFGVILGGVLGTVGIVVSGIMKFSIARLVGRDVLQRWGGEFPQRLERRLGSLGPAAVAFTTAYPIGPLAPVHWAAGLAPISLGAFALALVISAPVRAFAYAFFGQNLVDVGSTEFWVATALLLATVAIPFLIPSVRARVRSAVRG